MTGCSRTYRTAALYALMFAATLYIVFGRLPGDTLLWREIQNTGHTLAFILITLACYGVMRNRAEACLKRSGACCLLVFSVAAIVAFATEFAQMLTGREPSVADLIRDLAGAAIGICMLYLNEVRAGARAARGLPVAGTVFVLAALVAAGLYPLGCMSLAYLQRNAAMPVVFDPGAGWTSVFLRHKDAHVSGNAGRILTVPNSRRDSVRVTLLPARYPGVTIIEPYPDWTGYRNLLIDIHSARPESFHLILRIHDETHNFALDDRFNTRLTVQQGHNRFVIPLASIRDAPKARQMDMRRIRDITWFANSPAGVLAFAAGPVRLE